MPRPVSVYFFGTCLIDLFFPEAGLAGMQLLRHAGMEVLFPRDQSCCGQPAFNSGYREESLAVARAQLKCFPEDIPVIVPSASCAAMIHKHWPELFAGEPDEPQARAIAERTWELTRFLVEVLDIQLQDSGEPIRVTLHHSCSARREMAVTRHAETLLGQLDRVELVPHAHAEECCGFGGTFSIKQPELSAAMTQSKCEAIEATGTQCLLSQDCGCLINLGSMLERRRQPLRIQHIAAFLWERSR